MSQQESLAILVGGGPAPGINSVISSATIRAVLEGVEVTGIRDGFEWIMQGDIDHVIPLTIEGVSRLPSAFVMTVGFPPSMIATTEFVVPRSIPMILLMDAPSRGGWSPLSANARILRTPAGACQGRGVRNRSAAPPSRIIRCEAVKA